MEQIYKAAIVVYALSCHVICKLPPQVQRKVVHFNGDVFEAVATLVLWAYVQQKRREMPKKIKCFWLIFSRFENNVIFHLFTDIRFELLFLWVILFCRFALSHPICARRRRKHTLMRITIWSGHCVCNPENSVISTLSGRLNIHSTKLSPTNKFIPFYMFESSFIYVNWWSLFMVTSGRISRFAE